MAQVEANAAANTHDMGTPSPPKGGMSAQQQFVILGIAVFQKLSLKIYMRSR